MANRNPPGRPKGTPKTGGRKKGTPNKATVEVREMAQRIIEEPVYRKRFIARAKAGRLSAPIETMLWHYAYGKPKETIEHQGSIVTVTPQQVSSMSDAQLAEFVDAGRKLAAALGKA